MALEVNRIIAGDCVEVMNALPEASIDLVFADPPYNLQLQNELWRPNSTRVDAVDDAWDQFGSLEEYDCFTRLWLEACRRVLKDTGTLWVIGSYHNIYRVGSILMDLGYWILNDIVWIKTNPMPNFRGVRFTNAHETLLWAQKNKGNRYTFNHHAMKAFNDDLQMRSDWEIPLCTGKERIRLNGSKVHATQKPEALLYRVLLSSSNPGDVILDPFFGSGTTGAVAKKLHRSWIGIERDPTYVQAAQERIDAVTAELRPEEWQAAPSRRERPRVAFGTLVQSGYIRAGQILYFAKTGETATVLANGSISHAGAVGSIHKIGSALKKGPCNGWELWYYLDETTGQKLALDTLREKYRAEAIKPEKSDNLVE